MPTPQERTARIEKIRALPGQIRELVAGLNPDQLTTPYLDGEWTVAQNVHHLVDSHLNSYLRCKLTLTQEYPTLIAYDQDVWAELPDAAVAGLEASLKVLEGLHARWVIFWQSLGEDDWGRTAYHPENGDITLDFQLEYYASHGEAHIDQITRTLQAGDLR